MKQYLDILDRILKEGTQKGDRTGTGTLSVFGTQSRYDLSKGFPLLTTKKLHLKSIIYELLWFLNGDTNVKYTFLGVPFNIASYALLCMMMAQVCGLKPGEFIHTTGDTHLYLNHLEQARLQLTREPRPLPTMKINPDVKSIFDFKYEDFQLEGYDPWPHIKAEVSV